MAGTNFSRQRQAIVDYLSNTKEHPTADMVYTRVRELYPNVSLGTVYRNLSMFKANGEIISIGTVNGVERFDGNTNPHVHFVCNGCEKVTDLMTIAVPEELNQEVTGLTGGQIDMCHLTFIGQCSQCKKKSEKGESA